jgi:hypothetical protein
VRFILLLHDLKQRIQQAGKTRVQIFPAQRNHILPSLRPLPDHTAVAQDAPVVGHGRLGHLFLTQGVAALLAAVGQDADDLQSQRVAERGKDIFQANLFSFGVIGDHNNPVSAVARRMSSSPYRRLAVIYPNSGSDATRAAAASPIVIIAKIVRIYSYSCTMIAQLNELRPFRPQTDSQND